MRNKFLGHHPDVPGMKYDKPYKFFGYWAPSQEIEQILWSESTMPEAKINALCSLPRPTEFVDENWNPEERDYIIAYLQAGNPFNHWRGYSYCRVCDISAAKMGSTDVSDGIYVWPEGFVHYVESHSVKPPQEFIEHALKSPDKEKIMKGHSLLKKLQANFARNQQ